MKRVNEIESKILDCQIKSLKLDWSKSPKLEIEFIKSDKIIRLIAEDLIEIQVFENEFESYYIGQIKCLLNDDNEIILSLDPYDERINTIDDRDNFVVRFKRFNIEFDH